MTFGIQNAQECAIILKLILRIVAHKVKKDREYRAEKEISLPRRRIQYALQTLTIDAFIQKLDQKAGTRYQLIF